MASVSCMPSLEVPIDTEAYIVVRAEVPAAPLLTLPEHQPTPTIRDFSDGAPSLL